MMELYQKGRISLSKAAELLDVSTFDILRLVKDQQSPELTGEQLKKSRDTAKSLTM